MANNGTYRWTPPQKNNYKPIDMKSIGKTVLIAVIVLLLVIAGATSFYTVDDKQQAVVTTFGQVTDVTDAGVHFKLPFGIQKARKVNVNV